MPTEVLTEQDADFLLHMIIRHSGRAESQPDVDCLRPRGVLTFDGSGGDDEPALVRTGNGTVVRIDRPGLEAVDVLARRLRAHLGVATATSDDDLRAEVLRLTCSVIDASTRPKTRNLGRRLLEETAERLARSVVVLPLSGVELRPLDDSSCPPLLLSGRVLLGRVDETTQDAISILARDQVSGGFTFSDDAWWTEDFNARRRDPQAFEEAEEPIAVLAVVVDAVDTTATLRARHLAEGVLGALWLVDQQDEPWPCAAPALLGAPTLAEDGRSPGLDPLLAVAAMALALRSA